MAVMPFANDVHVRTLGELIAELHRAKLAVGDAPVFINVDAANKWNVKIHVDKAQNRVYLMAGDHA